jgi:hypothetical protein
LSTEVPCGPARANCDSFQIDSTSPHPEFLGADIRRTAAGTESPPTFGTDPVEEFLKLAEVTMKEFPNSVCFASKLIFKQVNILTRWLHNHTPLEIQARLHQQGKQMVLLPMNVG